VTAHTKVFQVIEGRNIPDWKKFLSVKENKQARLEDHTGVRLFLSAVQVRTIKDFLV
jgi:hypothetical protein